MREQLKNFFTALMFLTRIPCPRWVDHTSDRLARACVYFPLVGALVGGIGAVVYRLVVCGYSPFTAVLCGMAATAIVTGAFHEDAFADVCDGFGGWTPERRLEIMRDSRVGSFGVVGLVLLIGIKAGLLSSMSPGRTMLAFLVGHTFGRWSTLMMAAGVPKAADTASLARSLTASITPGRFLAATIIAAGAGLLWGTATTLLLFLTTLLFCLGAGRFFRNWLGGISGDCLGAVNQVVEMLCYAVMIHSATLETAARHLLRGS